MSCIGFPIHFTTHSLLRAKSTLPVWGHPFMTSTQVDGEGVSAMWTSTQKSIAHRRHPVFFSSKEVGIIFKPEFRLWTE